MATTLLTLVSLVPAKKMATKPKQATSKTAPAVSKPMPRKTPPSKPTANG